MEVAKIRTNDFESGYKATAHLIEQGCKRIAYLYISNNLDINNKRLAGCKKALADNDLAAGDILIVQCTNDLKCNYDILLEAMNHEDRADGFIASVEKLITPFYLVCKDLMIKLPSQVKVISFSNLPTAQILKPTLTTITQPAFEIGKVAATILFKALEKSNYKWQAEDIVIPSELYIRESSVNM
jgi:LacI family transcriptional regulator